MFDFERLDVYYKAKELNKDIFKLLKENKRIDTPLRNQLRRASLSIPLNIAEGSGRFTKADRKNFYTIARGSTYECAALMEIMLDENHIEKPAYKEFYSKYETISKMLLGLINSQR